MNTSEQNGSTKPTGRGSDTAPASTKPARPLVPPKIRHRTIAELEIGPTALLKALQDAGYPVPLGERPIGLSVAGTRITGRSPLVARWVEEIRVEVLGEGT